MLSLPKLSPERQTTVSTLGSGKGTSTSGESSQGFQDFEGVVASHLAFSFNGSCALRGLPTTALLRFRAAVLSGSGDTSHLSIEDTTELDQLDFFLSHNWSVPRWRKFLSLALYFNFASATAVASFVAALFFCFEAYGILPLPLTGVAWAEERYGEDDRDDARMGVFVIISTPLAFFLTCFFKHDIMHRICPGSWIFLDKVCIHQTDKELKQKGISKLGAFMGKSSHMLILYSDVYLRKLWTVYEMACFLVTHSSTSAMDVLHIQTASLFLACVIAIWFATIANLMPLPTPEWLVLLFSGPIYAKACRRWHKSLASDRKFLSTFRIEDAICSEETDRPFVESNIEAFMKLKQYVPISAKRSEALDAFNGLVQEIVSYLFQTSLSSPLPYRYIVALVCLTRCSSALDCISALTRKYGLFDVNVLVASMHYISIAFCFNPLGAAWLSWMTSKCLFLCGWREWAWIMFSLLAVLIALVPLVNLFHHRFLIPKARTSNAFLIAFIMFHSTTWAITAFVRIRRVSQRKRSDAKLVKHMENYKRECSTHRRVSQESRESFDCAVKMLQGIHSCGTDSSKLSSTNSSKFSSSGESTGIQAAHGNIIQEGDSTGIQAVHGNRIQEGDQQAPTLHLNQPAPQILGQS